MGEGRHVRFTVESRGARARAVAFGIGTSLPVQDGEPAQATFALEVNEWRGVSEPRLVLRRARAASMAADERPPAVAAGTRPPEVDPAAIDRRPPIPASARGFAPREREREGEFEELVLFALE